MDQISHLQTSTEEPSENSNTIPESGHSSKFKKSFFVLLFGGEGNSKKRNFQGAFKTEDTRKQADVLGH